MSHPTKTQNPDYILKEGTHEGFNYMICHNGNGFRCGYIEILEGHPWWNKDYNDIEADVHGGLTYADKDYDNYNWWIGFDCAHLYDRQDVTLPAEIYMPSFGEGGTIKTTEYVENECKSLCEQAKKGANE